MNYSVVRIPVQSLTRKYYLKRYAARVDARGMIELDKNHAFGMKIIHYLDIWWGSWELPRVDGCYLAIKLPKTYMRYGIQAKKLKELGRLLDMEAMEFLVAEIACAAQYPGVSVTDAILTVMGRFDISEEEYRSDSMRRHFDRYSEEVMGQPFKEFAYTLHRSVRVLYEELVRKQVPVNHLVHD